MTVRDLISGSLRLLGVLASGEQPTAAEAQDALASLNSMIDSWQNERLMLYAILPQTFSLVAGKLSYTMGPGGDWNAVRPVRIDKIQFSYTQNGTPNPLNLPIEIIDLDQYQQFVVPGTASSIPMWVYPDSGYPLRTLYFYTVPTAAESVQIFSWSQLASFATLDDAVAFPPGYERALRYGLALELADEYGVPVSVPNQAKAGDAKAKIKSINSASPLMQADAALISHRAGFNYLTGE